MGRLLGAARSLIYGRRGPAMRHTQCALFPVSSVGCAIAVPCDRVTAPPFSCNQLALRILCGLTSLGRCFAQRTRTRPPAPLATHAVPHTKRPCHTAQPCLTACRRAAPRRALPACLLLNGPAAGCAAPRRREPSASSPSRQPSVSFDQRRAVHRFIFMLNLRAPRPSSNRTRDAAPAATFWPTAGGFVICHYLLL